ncbi:MAG: ACT domain-containing protein [Thermoplasmatota archaeon]
MTRYEIIKIKEDGNIMLPSDCAVQIGAVKGAYFLLEVSPDLKETRLERVALPGKDLAEIELILKDEPGVLATMSGLFARHRANILFNESEEISDKEAVLVAVMDISEMDITLEELQEKAAAEDAVLGISVKKVE